MRSILKYPGAKWALAPWIVRHLPQTPHYVEPFFGSGAVFFNLPWRPKHAVLNDLSGDVVNLFRVIRDDGERLAALIEMTPWARAEYEQSYEPCDDPLERARRFLVRSWQSYGRRDGERTGWSQKGARGTAITWERWREAPARLTAAIDLLRQAEIEQRPALDVIARQRSSRTLIYADPPYVLRSRSTRGQYVHEMTDADHAALLDALDAHPVALSGYRCALYDDRLTAWRRVETQAVVEGGGVRAECLWLNPVCASVMAQEVGL